MSKDSTLLELYNQWKLRGNENFMEIKQVYEDHNNIYVLLEEKPPCLAEILKKRVFFLEGEVQYLFCQLVTILESLRRNNIFHGNISLSNLYLCPKTYKLKLSGFSSTINLENYPTSSLSPHLNLFICTEPTPYIAPELLQDNVDNYYVYYSADIWAVGVVIYTLLTGGEPFIKKGQGFCLAKLKNYEFEFGNMASGNMKTVGNSWKELIKHFLQPEKQRINLKSLIEHPLNQITESKSPQFPCTFSPPISCHSISQTDLTLENLFTTSLHSLSKPAVDILTGGIVNSEILRSILLQKYIQNNNEYLPLKCSQPAYIERYCHVQHNGSVGYVLDNCIGVVYEDGSCAIGHNLEDFLYFDNEILSMDEIVNNYCEIYEEFYFKSETNEVDPNGKLGKARVDPKKHIDESYISLQSQQKEKSHEPLQTKSQINGILLSNRKNSKLSKSKLLPSRSFPLSPVVNLHEHHTISEAQFGESMWEFRHSISSSKKVTSQKYEIYKYYVQFFGERVIETEIKIWVLGFWKLTYGVIFLYSDGAWQINLTQEIHKSQYQANTYTNSNGTNDLKKGKEGAVLLDKYGIGWWLKPKNKTVEKNGKVRDMFEEGREKNNFLVQDINKISNMNLGKGTKAKNGLSNLSTINSNFNALSVKIGRKLVSVLKSRFIKEFENIMEPCKYHRS